MEKKNWKLRIGITLMVLSVPLFFFAPVVPFLDLEKKAKITLSTLSLVAGEVTFWSGGLLVGKELFTRYKAYFNPKNWFRKKPAE
jgi:hypothetical protein